MMSFFSCFFFVFVYLNDILNFSSAVEEHISHIRLVLTRLLENKLFVKAEKCEFRVDTVSFLGFIIQEGSIKANPVKLTAHVPATRSQMHSLAFTLLINLLPLRTTSCRPSASWHISPGGSRVCSQLNELNELNSAHSQVLQWTHTS